MARCEHERTIILVRVCPNCGRTLHKIGGKWVEIKEEKIWK
jgi:predicted HNH restriction endonuclease